MGRILCTILTSCRVIYVVVVPLKKGRGPIRHIKNPDELDLEEVNIPFFLPSLYPCVTDTVEPETWKVFSQEHCGNVPRGFVRERGQLYSSHPYPLANCHAWPLDLELWMAQGILYSVYILFYSM